MIELCDTLLEFYPKEIAKIGGRIERFEKIKAEWEAKADSPKPANNCVNRSGESGGI